MKNHAVPFDPGGGFYWKYVDEDQVGGGFCLERIGLSRTARFFLDESYPAAINGGGRDIKADQYFFRLSGIHWNSDPEMKSVMCHPQLRNWQASIRDALLESNVTPYNGFNLDHLIGTKIGGSTFDGFGLRHTAADLLNQAKPSNVRVALHASVERILFNTLDSTSPLTPPSSGFASTRKPVAIGVSYRDKMGKSHHAMVRGRGKMKLILCTGAFGSPKLLLLSCIGQRLYLSPWGIPVVQYIPYVDQYLYDNGITIVPPVPMEHSLIQVVRITDVVSNVIPFTSPPRSVFLHAPGSSSLYLTAATIMEKIVEPLSYGSLRLPSRDVRVIPLIRFNHFSNAEDLGRCVHGMRKIGELLRGRSLEEFKFQEWFGGRDFRFVGTTLPLNLSDDQLMEDFCRRTLSTIWHYHGGCIVGKVVESDHRVIGVDNLRIVDGSILSVSPGTNPQATVMMMGRYGVMCIFSPVSDNLNVVAPFWQIYWQEDSGREKTKRAQKIAIHGTDSGLVSMAV